MMATASRRLISISLAIVLLPLFIVLIPVVFVLGGIADMVEGRRALPTFRLWLFAIVFIMHEWVVAPYAGWLWLRGGFGRSMDIPRHREIQEAWVGSLFRWAGRLLNVSVSLPEAESVPEGKIVVLSRHASMIDAVIPAHHFASRLHRPIHYVLKRELRWLPSIDIYGHRLGNHFIDRTGNTESEVAAIIELIESAEPNAGIVIFPEGTYATPAARDRVLASLERKGDAELLEFAKQLRYLLPPKPAGALALLRRTKDVVIFGHVGLEGVAELQGLRRNLPAKRPILTQTWSFQIADLPDLDEARIAWLRDHWLALDAWVGDQHAAGGNGHVRP